MASYAGRVALVTGAGRGLGRAHALALALQGTSVVVNDNGALLDGTEPDDSVAQSVVDEIVEAGGFAVASTDDVSTHAGAEAAVQRALDEWGRLDAVVNNAGILRDRSFAKMSMTDFDAVLTTHLAGSAYVTKAAWPSLCESGTGRVVFTSSASGLFGQFGQANYGAAKAGMVGLVNVLKQEGGRKGVLVNAIAPAARTRMTESLMPDEAKAGMDPDRVAPVVAWLASEECDRTGLVLEVAGGLVGQVRVVETEPLSILDADGGLVDVGSVVKQLGDLPVGQPYDNGDAVMARYLANAVGS